MKSEQDYVVMRTDNYEAMWNSIMRVKAAGSMCDCAELAGGDIGKANKVLRDEVRAMSQISDEQLGIAAEGA